MHLDYQSITNIGKRGSNQDYYLAHRVHDQYLFAVCDGLGAYAHSDLASRYFCQALQEAFSQYLPKITEDPREGVQEYMQAAYRYMMDKLIQAKHPEAKTTAVVALLNTTRSLFAHVGDSRLYRIQNGKPIWRTTDYSVAQDLVFLGQLSEQELLKHPLRNMLSRSLGVEGMPLVDISIQKPLLTNEAVLLCSDGFWENMTDLDILNFSRAIDLKVALQSYVQALIETVPSLDNTTAIYVRY